MSFWRDMITDEQGTPSMGRFLVTGALVFAGWFTVQDIGGREVGDTIYDFWQPIILTLIVWAAGPRLAQYLGPVAAAAVQRIRGLLSSSFRETEVKQETKIVEDDPVPEKSKII